MRIMIPVEEKMASEAEFGFYYLYYVITLKKAEELRDLGFVVTDSKEQRSSPRLHKIDWSQAGKVFEGVDDIHSLNERDEKYTLPQKLWITSSKAKKIS